MTATLAFVLLIALALVIGWWTDHTAPETPGQRASRLEHLDRLKRQQARFWPRCGWCGALTDSAQLHRRANLHICSSCLPAVEAWTRSG